MKIDDVLSALDKVKEKSPLIHAITNPISINQCANCALSVGARPIMAEHPLEVKEITKSADALVLNLGSITDSKMEAMKISSKTAKEENIPSVFDLVGVSCSPLRRDFALSQIENCSPAIIKGNYSETYAMYESSHLSSGVDSDKSLSIDKVKKASVNLSKKYGCTVLASGKTDIIAKGENVYYIKNGSPNLAKITGTGCMLGELCGCFLSVTDGLSSAICATLVLGISGELSSIKKGNGSFLVNLIDNISKINAKKIKKYIKLEEEKIENI